MHRLKPSPQSPRPFKPIMANVVGIDVGGIRKGYHAVLLSNGNLEATFQHTDPTALAAWVEDSKAITVAIDAPVDGAKMAALEKLNASYNIIKPVSPAFVHPLVNALNKVTSMIGFLTAKKSIPLFKK